MYLKHTLYRIAFHGSFFENDVHKLRLEDIFQILEKLASLQIIGNCSLLLNSCVRPGKSIPVFLEPFQFQSYLAQSKFQKCSQSSLIAYNVISLLLVLYFEHMGQLFCL